MTQFRIPRSIERCNKPSFTNDIDFEILEHYRKLFRRGRSQTRELRACKRGREVAPPRFSRVGADFAAVLQGKLLDLFREEHIETQGVGDLLNSIANAPGVLGDAFAGFNELVGNVNRVANVVGQAENLPGSFDKVVAAAERYANEGVRVRHMSPMQEMLLSGVLFAYFYSKEGAICKAISLAAGLYGLSVAANLLATSPSVRMLFERVLDLVKPSNMVLVAQGPTLDKVSPAVQVSSALVLLYQRLTTYQVEPDASSLERFMASIRASRRAFKQANETTKTVEETLLSIQDLINNVCALVGTDWRANFSGEYWVEIDEMRETYNKLRSDFDERKELSSVAAQAKALLTRLESTSVKRSSAMYAQHRDLRNLVYSLCSELRGFGAFGNAERVEPFVITLSGDPGIGKSLVSKAIQDVLARKLLSSRAYSDFVGGTTANVVWAPNLAETFDSGYNNQAIVLLDDLGYSKESNDIVIPKFIQWVNQVPTQTNQAALERKGAIFFDSKLILCTTNLVDFGRATERLATPEAFYRRMHANYRAVLQPAFDDGSGKLDISKVTDQLLSSSGCWLRFQTFDPATGLVTGPLLTFGEVLEKILTQFDSRMNIHQIKVGKSRAFAAQLSTIDINDSKSVRSFVDRLGAGVITQGPGGSCVESPEAIEAYFRNPELDCPVGCYCYGAEVFKLHNMRKTGYCNHCGYASGAQDIEVSWVEPGKFCWNNARLRSGGLLDAGCSLHIDAYFREVLYQTEFKKKGSLPTLLSAIRDSFTDCAHKLWERCKEALGQFWSTLLLAGAAISCGFWAVKHTMERSDPVEELDIDPLISQSRDQGAIDQGRKVVVSNIVWLSTENGDQIGAGLALGGDLIMLNRHIYDAAVEASFDTVVIDRYHHTLGPRSWRIGKESLFGIAGKKNPNAYIVPNADLCVVRADKFLGADIRNLFAQSKLEWDAMRTRQVSVYFWEPDSEGNAHKLSMHGPARGFREISATAPNGQRYATTNTIEYELSTYVGMCGAPVFINDPTISAKLCGIHIAGHGSRVKGYAARVTRDMIDAAFDFFRSKTIFVNSNSFIREKVRYDVFPEAPIPDATVVGVCETPTLHLKTQYKRSPLAGMIDGVGIDKYPAVLTPKYVDGVLVDPVVKNIVQYSRGSIMPNMNIYAGAANAFVRYLKKFTQPYNHPGPLDFEQACGGYKWRWPNLAPLTRATSAGFPDGLYFKDKKRSIFGTDEWTFDTEECEQLREVVAEMHEHLKATPVDFIYMVFPKDELRPKDRVKSLKTRMIMASPVSATVLTRMYFGPFIDWFMDPRNRLFNCSAVGIDMSNEADLRAFVNWHHNGHPNYRVFAGDYSGFDKDLSPWHMDIVRRVNEEFIRADWTEEQKQIAENILISSTYPTVAVKGNLIQWSNGNPSGDNITTPKNSKTNTFAKLQAIAKIVLGEGASEARVAHFIYTSLCKGYIRITDFGDDTVFSVIRGIHEGWNFDLVSNASMAKALAELGFKYTDEQKNSDFSQEVDRTIFDVSFLKRRVRDSEIGLVAYLDIDTILQNIQWMKAGPDELDVWADKLENFLNELAVHPDAVWDEYYPKLVGAYYRAVPNGDFSFSPTRLERMKRWRSRSLLMGTFCDEEPHREDNQIHVLGDSMAENPLRVSHDLAYNAAQGDLRLAGDRVEGAERQDALALGSEAYNNAHTQGPWLVGHGARSKARDISTSNNDINNTLAMGETGQDGVALVHTAPAITAARDSDRELDPKIAMQYAPNEIGTVADYLNKQVPVDDFNWSTADGIGLLKVDEESWNYVSGTNLWIEKLTGFYGVRGTLCLRLTINGTPFHSGRLRLCYYPDASSSNNKYRSHTFNFISLSQLPGVEIEANESSVELKIPYVTVSRFIELTSSKRTWGRIFVAVAAPLATGPDGIQSVNCRLWAWMEDVELFGQTHQFVTQGPRKRLAPADAEGTPVASFLAGSARAVGSLSGIPTIAAYAGPTAWALNLASGVAAAFGWSKPNSKASVARVTNNPTAVLANCNGEDPSHMLSLDADAKLRTITDVAPSGQDEMSINFIKRQWSYLSVFTYSTGSSLTDPIYELSFVPQNLGLFISPTLNFITPVAYLARMFAFYRGGVEVKIKFAKTALHRGKLQVSYVPGPVPATNTLSQAAYLHRTVIDLAEGGEICIAFPYMLPVDYMETSIPFGRMYVHAVTGLNCPETVSPNVQCSVYVRAMDDMHFVQPMTSNLIPFNDPIVTQGPNDLVNTGEIDCNTVGDAVDPNMDVAFAESSASEVVTSVAQLLKRFVHIGLPFTGFGYFRFYPWANKGRFAVAGDAMDTSYHSYVMSPYAFFRGGVKLKLTLNNGLVTSSDAQKLSRINAWFRPTGVNNIFTMSPAVPDPNTDDRGYLAETEAFGTATALIVQVPYQNAWRMAPNRLYNLASEVPGFDQPRGAVVASAPSGVGGLARAYADDFQLLFFVGLPMMEVR